MKERSLQQQESGQHDLRDWRGIKDDHVYQSLSFLDLIKCRDPLNSRFTAQADTAGLKGENRLLARMQGATGRGAPPGPLGS